MCGEQIHSKFAVVATSCQGRAVCVVRNTSFPLWEFLSVHRFVAVSVKVHSDVCLERFIRDLWSLRSYAYSKSSILDSREAYASCD